MQNSKFNILENFTEQEYNVIRKRIISCILATDMANHFNHLTELKSKLKMLEITEGKNIEKLFSDEKKINENQQMILDNTIHLCDISNPAKLGDVYDKWVDLVFKEFFNQGDLERQAKKSISLLCDRETVKIPKAQIGFINYIVKPYFDVFYDMIPEIKPYVNNIQMNLERYRLKELKESEEENKNK